MTGQKLNLLQLAASGATEPRATPPEIMRREFAYTNFRGELLDDVPDQFFRNSIAPGSARAAHPPEKASRGNSGGRRPVIQQAIHPIGNWYCSNVTSFPTQVHDCPMAFTLLQGDRRTAWRVRGGEVRRRAAGQAVHDLVSP